MATRSVGRKVIVLERGDMRTIAKSLKRTPGHISRVFAGKRESARTIAAIEKLLGAKWCDIRVSSRGAA